MNRFLKISHADYLQRTRSYAFLITLAIALYIAYAFVPPAGAHYKTLRIGNYAGLNNAAWIAYVTAMMTSVFLSIAGFFLVNSTIKKDIDTGVGMIIATTGISNFRYLLAKAWSNLQVLLSMLGVIILMSIAVFFIRPGDYPFEPLQFIFPYLIITLPALCFISALAVTAEVFFRRSGIWINVVFFMFAGMMLSAQPKMQQPAFDLFGIRAATMSMQENILQLHPHTPVEISMGFIFSKHNTFHPFLFEGVHWSAAYLLSRLLWVGAGLLLILISSRFFHRFDISPAIKKEKKSRHTEPVVQGKPLQDISLSALPVIKPSYRISPLVRTELLLLFRKGPRWLWLLNIGGMAAMIFAPLTIAHQLILPALWFLQVNRWSDLVTKEKTNRVHYFAYASYRPLTRLFTAQLMAGIGLSVLLASPLLLRYLIGMQWLTVISIITGSVFIVLCAVLLGLISGGKKLFEILFFLCAYANINKTPFTDYFGGLNHSTVYLAWMAGVTICLYLVSFQWRKYEIRN